MISNVKLFNYCLENPESYADKYYSKNSSPVITSDSRELNELMKANLEIIENIAAYKIASKSGNKKMKNIIIGNISKLLSISGINNSEFTSYWSTKDMSHSAYMSFVNSPGVQFGFLKSVISDYISERDSLYKNHGYSFSTIQALKDSKAHKENGGSGSNKVVDILEKAGFVHFTGGEAHKFLQSNQVYICSDKTDKKIFKEILKTGHIKFKWSDKHEGKQTDFVFKRGDRLFILEHKHMKEAGGGQDKQMSEIIDFVSHQDRNVSYVAFLDGIYFNIFTDDHLSSGKHFNQKKGIISALAKNIDNYFVNTAGFVKLLGEII